MKEKSFRVYIHRTLKTVNSDLHITKPAIEAIDSILRLTANQLVDRALLLTRGSEKKTVSPLELKTAISLVLPQDMTSNFVDVAEKVCEKFQEAEDSRPEPSGAVMVKPQTRESRAGLIFSVSACEKYIRCFGQSGFHVSGHAPVFLASILQQFTASLLDKAGKQTVSSDRVTISVRHMFLAVADDKDLRKFVDSLNIVFLEAGVESHIEEKLLEKKSRKRSKNPSSSSSDGEKKVHRWRPGTKTLMDIRRLQKSSEMLIQHAPFCRLLREIGEKRHENLRCTAEFLTSMQAFVEDRVIRVMKLANRVSIHSGRETVYGKDVQFAQELSCLHETNNQYETNIPEASLRKMALRAGIKRYGDDSTESYRALLVSLLETYVSDIVLCAQCRKVQTLNTALMLESLSMRGIHPSITPHKRHSSKRGSSSRTESVAESEDSDKSVSDVEKEALPTIDE